MGNTLSQRWVEAAATLFDKGEMKARCVGDRLDAIIGSKIVIAARNRRKLANHQSRNRLRKCRSQIGVFRVTAIPRPPAGIYGKLHEVGEAPDLPGTCRTTARQVTKTIKIDRIRAFCDQVFVEERGMAYLVISVVMDILLQYSPNTENVV
jgi:hypothetical protein